MNLSSLPVTHRAVIPQDFIDEFGHVNVMWYTLLFTEAAGGLFQLVGLTPEHFTTSRTGSFALAQHFRYLKEVRLGQLVTLRSREGARDELEAENERLLAEREAIRIKVQRILNKIDAIDPEIAEAISG